MNDPLTIQVRELRSEVQALRNLIDNLPTKEFLLKAVRPAASSSRDSIVMLGD